MIRIITYYYPYYYPCIYTSEWMRSDINFLSSGKYEMFTCQETIIQGNLEVCIYVRLTYAHLVSYTVLCICLMMILGFCFVEFVNGDDREAAVDKLDGFELDGTTTTTTTTTTNVTIT